MSSKTAIKVTDTDIVLPDGLRLAVIDSENKVVETGPTLNKSIFASAKDTAIKTMLKGFRVTHHQRPASHNPS